MSENELTYWIALADADAGDMALLDWLPVPRETAARMLRRGYDVRIANGDRTPGTTEVDGDVAYVRPVVRAAVWGTTTTVMGRVASGFAFEANETA
jgi:hypothetical protein